MKRVSLLFAGLAACACETNPIELSEGCLTTADCAPHTVCNAFEGVCEPEPDQGFVGTFTCVPRADNPSTAEWYTDVVGSLAGERYVLGAAPVCGLDIFDPQHLFVSLISAADQGLSLALSVDLDDLRQAGTRLEIEPVGETPGEAPRNSAWLAREEWVRNRSLPDPESETPYLDEVYYSNPLLNLGFSTGGLLYVKDAFELGKPLTAFLSIDMVPTKDVFVDWAAQCSEGGAASCGQAMDALCETGPSDEPFCTYACTAGEDCGWPTGCIEGRCLIPCSEDAGCPSYLRCDTSLEAGGCR